MQREELPSHNLLSLETIRNTQLENQFVATDISNINIMQTDVLTLQLPINDGSSPTSLLYSSVHFMSKNLQNWKQLDASNYILTIIAGIVINIEDSITFKTLKQPLFTREQQSFLKETFGGLIETIMIKIKHYDYNQTF